MVSGLKKGMVWVELRVSREQPLRMLARVRHSIVELSVEVFCDAQVPQATKAR
jgi:hypothetical protein